MGAKDQIETDLWSLFKSGDKSAFEEIYRLHIAALLSYGTRYCNDQNILKDSIQDLFVELWHSRDHLANVSSVRFYLIKSLRYKLTRRVKSLTFVRTELSAEAPNGGDFSRFAVSPEAEIIEKEIEDARIETLRRAIHFLSRRQQEVIQLRFFQGFTNEQIAELMHMNYQSVSNLVYTSLCRIRKNLRSAPVFTTALLAALHLIF
ncbi:MAG TPA: sigma-70 family RNA polymerase sigma factor [Puia sp.]|nr:sigma-70 family RNA polymerase sigma factor [Puia sp.]